MHTSGAVAEPRTSDGVTPNSVRNAVEKAAGFVNPCSAATAAIGWFVEDAAPTDDKSWSAPKARRAWAYADPVEGSSLTMLP